MNEDNGTPPNKDSIRKTRKGFPIILAAFVFAFVASLLVLHFVMGVLGGVNNTFSQFVNAAGRGVGELVSGLLVTGVLPVSFIATAFSCCMTSKPRKRILGAVLASCIVEFIWALPFAVGAHC